MCVCIYISGMESGIALREMSSIVLPYWHVWYVCVCVCVCVRAELRRSQEAVIAEVGGAQSQPGLPAGLPDPPEAHTHHQPQQDAPC